MGGEEELRIFKFPINDMIAIMKKKFYKNVRTPRSVTQQNVTIYNLTHKVTHLTHCVFAKHFYLNASRDAQEQC